VGLKQITAATGDVVTLEEAKAHCSIDGTAWDSLLPIYIDAAVAAAEDYLGRALRPQQWQLTLDTFPAGAIELPRGPVTAIDSVDYLDAERVEQVLDDAFWIADLISDPQQIVRDPEQQWPETARVPNAVSVTFTTGFAQPPAVVKLAVLQCVAAWFTDREAGMMPIGAQQLLRPLRVIVI